MASTSSYTASLTVDGGQAGHVDCRVEGILTRRGRRRGLGLFGSARTVAQERGLATPISLSRALIGLSPTYHDAKVLLVGLLYIC